MRPFHLAASQSESRLLLETACTTISFDGVRRHVTTILDVGVSDMITKASNALERKYPFPAKITAVGLGAGKDFQAAFPAVVYYQIETGERLPFPDGQFAISTANAVLEHVGSLQKQINFISELLRVARKIFITVPNRFFPIEHHTAIPVMH